MTVPAATTIEAEAGAAVEVEEALVDEAEAEAEAAVEAATSILTPPLTTIHCQLSRPSLLCSAPSPLTARLSMLTTTSVSASTRLLAT